VIVHVSPLFPCLRSCVVCSSSPYRYWVCDVIVPVPQTAALLEKEIELAQRRQREEEDGGGMGGDLDAARHGGLGLGLGLGSAACEEEEDAVTRAQARTGGRESRRKGGGGGSGSRDKYTYQEAANPEEFFVPYIWTIAVSNCLNNFFNCRFCFFLVFV
jgi:hypothetical protein